ncbi:MAG: Flp pilus assembly complex ATPase component TadA [Candidatus Thorarchaeota archaeon]|nr:Flp pilus assembly complex ATPase component TadA [Candidatus Thorarchaeota archaeon]
MEGHTRTKLCPKSRCSECADAPFPDCIDNPVSGGEGRSDSVMLLEPERNTIHLARWDEIRPEAPPWEGGDWESVYVEGLSQKSDLLDNVIRAYTVGPYLSIFCRQENSAENLHFFFPLVRTALESRLLDTVCAMSQPVESGLPPRRIPLSERIRNSMQMNEARVTEALPEVSHRTRAIVSEVAAHRNTALGSIFALLLDDDVEEIYLDRPGLPLYFDHSELGRCVSSAYLTVSDVSRVCTLIRSESNLHLDRANPSLKTDMSFGNSSMRFSVALPPLSTDGLHMEIRKARCNPLTIRELIHNGTMPRDVGALLVLAVAARFNIAITGGPSSGKTTLLNALDMTTPRHWRKIYIEDAVESRVTEQGHQVRFRVDPVDEGRGKLSKSSEIIKTLHRSPDYVILGEIQSIEHSQALFQAMSAGLRTIQTCHSDSAPGLVTRWINDHGIKPSSVAMIDMIVTLVKPAPGSSARRVSQIVEVRRTVKDGVVEFLGLNEVFDWKCGVLSQSWAKDGAFLMRAREAGVGTHVEALSNVFRLLDEYSQGISPGEVRIGEILWSCGNPMQFQHNLQGT